METLSTILEKAKQRAADLNLPYAGALTPQEAFQVLQLTQNAKLVDVRTRAELELVGRVPQQPISNGHFILVWLPILILLHKLKLS